MQFHLNGYRSGDPGIAEAAGTAPVGADEVPDTVDVLIVGCGPAGLTLAAQLAAFPEIRTLIVDQKPGRLVLGQADGIACRTMEMFEAFGFANRVLKEAYWVNETAFWKPDAQGRIVRSGRIQDTEDGLSEFPHVILNQARVHDFYLDVMERGPTRLVPRYGCRFLDLAVAHEPADHPVTVRLERCEGAQAGAIETVRARYVVGCDGARSGVRRALGLALHGDSANQAWGVMDVLAVTDFPDVRLKAVIHSAGAGSGLIIPREGGYLIRLYIELDTLGEDERVAERGITLDRLIAAAQRILHPYPLDVKEVAWWSVYEIGQRLCDRFDDVAPGESRPPRVFIAGDACHTHSPKAGQGMNVSMQDGFNLGWKLAAVLRGQAGPQLLSTYSAERHTIAAELIAFDRELARMISAASKSPEGGGGVDPAEFQRYFQKQGRFTAGTATRYAPGSLTAGPELAHQHLAQGFVVGTRFHSAPVIRLADAKPMQLGHVIKADGRWRLFLFAGAASDREPGLSALCAYLADAPDSPLRRITPDRADIDSIIDVRAVMQEPHRSLALGTFPALLAPRKGKHGLVDYEKVFCPDSRAGDIFDLRGIDRAAGCLVVVRPDQYVATVLPLDAYDELASFFENVMRPAETVRVG